MSTRELQQALRHIEDKILDVRKKVIQLYQYIDKVLAPTGTELSEYVEWDTQAIVNLFNKINDYPIINENDSVRFRFAIGFAKGGIHAQVKTFPVLTAELHDKLNDWGILKAKLGRAGNGTRDSMKARAKEIFESTEQIIVGWRELREVVHISGYGADDWVSSGLARLSRTPKAAYAYS